MAILLEHIDKIARDKQRAVLFVTFDHKTFPGRNYEHWEARSRLLAWLDEHAIPCQMCMDMAREDGWSAYRGQLYIDVPYDEDDPTFQALNAYIMTEHNEPRTEGVVLYCLPLEVAMRNKHHDAPGFWEKWAETF
jgi:hypothetical protein